MADEVIYSARRNRMVDEQIVRRGIRDDLVVSAMRKVPRHLFVEEKYRQNAYTDAPQPIGEGQTISQPYIVASMTEHLKLNNKTSVLEIGTGCGYQTAILAEIAEKVYSIERVESLHKIAEQNLSRLGYENVICRHGDGSEGWKEYAPFDCIIVTAVAKDVPNTLIKQLKLGGRMVIPMEVGHSGRQELQLIVRTEDGFNQAMLYEVRFVPLLGGIKLIDS